MKISTLWKQYKDKQVKLIIKDGLFVRSRDGIFKDIDDMHLFLLVEGDELPKPFLRGDIKRVEIQNASD